MFEKIKRSLYFPIASYFCFFAKIRIFLWSPCVVVITGSNGKTTLLHLVESQLGNSAKYSHKANSSFGIPFDILGLHRKDLTLLEWPVLFLLTPFCLLKKIPKEKIYIVEADCDRSGEGKFLSNLLRPDITLWTNVSRTHSVNFGLENLKSIEDAIAYEFGYFAQKTKSLLIANDDNLYIKNQLGRVACEVKLISLSENLRKYEITLVGTKINTTKDSFSFPYLLPKEILTSILMSFELSNYLEVKSDKTFKNFKMPPGRSSFYKGIKNTTIVDSTYNANLDSMRAILGMFGKIESSKKWVVLGDMLEQGNFEAEEHQKLAQVISKYKFSKIILMGPRITKYTYPKLLSLASRSVKIETFINPKDVLNFLNSNIKGGEIILFKGARFLEGVIEQLLENKGDAKSLARREKIWEIRRKKWGL